MFSLFIQALKKGEGQADTSLCKYTEEMLQLDTFWSAEAYICHSSLPLQHLLSWYLDLGNNDLSTSKMYFTLFYGLNVAAAGENLCFYLPASHPRDGYIHFTSSVHHCNQRRLYNQNSTRSGNFLPPSAELLPCLWCRELWMKWLLLYHTLVREWAWSPWGLEFFYTYKEINRMHANAKGRYRLFAALKIGNTWLYLSGCGFYFWPVFYGKTPTRLNNMCLSGCLLSLFVCLRFVWVSDGCITGVLVLLL